jgi:hypothetical protein
VPKRFLFVVALGGLTSWAGCVADGDPDIAGGEGEAEGEDPCDEHASGRRYGIMPGMCPGTSVACSDKQAPTACNVRPGGLTCTSPPAGTTVLEVCPACVAPQYDSISAAVADIPAVPATRYWIQVEAGSYTDNVTVTKDSTSTNTITIAARCSGGTRDAVTVTASTANPVFDVTPAATKSVTLEGFRVVAAANASSLGTVSMRGETGTIQDVVVTGATNQAAFYVSAKDATLKEIDAHSSLYGLKVTASDVTLERGAFCGSTAVGILLDGGSGFRGNATLTKDSGESGVRVGENTTVSGARFTRLLTTGQRSATGFGVELWDAAGFELWHSQVTNNTFGLSIDLGATDVDVENTLFSRFAGGTAVVVQGGYSGADRARFRFCTFADGDTAMDVNANIDIGLERNIFYAGSAPGGYGLDLTSTGGATLSDWPGGGQPLENLFYGNYGLNQQCADACGDCECGGVVAFSTDPLMIGNGYYLDDVVNMGTPLSGGVDAAGANANTITLTDGTHVSDYTTSLDLDLDGGAADLGFHHPPCFETVGDEGCGDGFCAGTETSGNCARDCL